MLLLDKSMVMKMKTRLLSAVIGIPILIAVLFFYDTIVLNIAIALICMIGVYEFLHSTKYVANPVILVCSMLFAGMIPFMNFELMKDRTTLVMLVYIVILIAILFARHNTLKFEEIGVAFTVSVLVPFALSSFVFVRDKYDGGIFYILLIFLCAWISDAGAYFIGRVFGKHRLAPTISPKKTIEGAVGGVIFCVIFNVAFTYGYTVITEDSLHLEANLIALIVVSFVGSIIGIFGDLFASIVKRQTGIKDFGNIIPGHGGIIDRFDSVLFIAPFIYVMCDIWPIMSTASDLVK